MLELNHYYNMDCMEGMRQFPDKFFDLAIVDPPWGRKEHGGKNRSGNVKQRNGTSIFVQDGGYIQKDWDNAPAGADYFMELFRVSKHQIVWGENYFATQFGHGRIVWDKCNQGTDQSDCEIAFNSLTSRVDLFRYMWRGMMQGKSLCEGHIQQGNKSKNEVRIHPAQKPVALYEWILLQYVSPGWKLIDTHVGSASSLIAFHNSGYDFVGFEKDADIYNLSCERLEAVRAQLSFATS